MNFIKTVFYRLMRKRECGRHFGEDDIIIENFRLNAVHEFPKKTSQGWELAFETETGIHKQRIKNLELDFYMDTKKDIYILRLQDKPENKIVFVTREIVSNRITPVTYIIVTKKLSENIDEELNGIIKKLKEIGFPEYYEEKIYEIKEWK
ncbi:MAG: hypothetical protein LBK13_08535 [Spirochaetales bacterium]|jgi:hypothetical protein|nr:hypothetical protein [Spirochaetales bacterium]